MLSFLTALFKPLAYISLPFILVRQIAVGHSPLRYYARCFIYVGTLMTVASFSMIVAVGYTLIGKSPDVNYFVATVFYRLVCPALDLSVEVEGEEHLKARPVVYMVNHQSMVDVLVIGKLMQKQTVIMAKKSLQFTPLGPFMSLSGTIFIDRGNSARAFRSVEAAGEKMKKDNISLWMYPEGTRRLFKTPDMLPLKKGGFHLAINAGIPIVPIVTENYWKIFRQGVFESGVIKVRVLPPIPTSSLAVADVGSLATRVRDEMLVALNDMYPAPAPTSTPPKVEASEAKPLDKKPAPQSGASEPIGSPSVTPPTTDAAPESPLGSKNSSSSLASSSVSSSRLKASGTSEAGTETEEDEGMVLVGRPANA